MRLVNQIKNEYKKISIKDDIISGIIVALVSIPISMGYAQIAGLPVVYGLYGSLLPILVFGLLTTSPQIVVGVDAMPAAMVGGMIAEMGIVAESKEAMTIVPVMSMLVAMWFVIFYFLKAGRIVRYISTPVMGGFISGVGITIIMMQIPKLFGGSPGTGEVFVLIENIVSQFSNFNAVSAILGFGTVAIILICKKYVPKVPMTVIMMAVGAVLEFALHLDRYGVRLLPEVAAGLPGLVIPDLRVIGLNTTDLLMRSVSIAAVIMAQTLLATGNYAMKHDDKIDNNKELLAYAGMNVAGAVVGCCPINGSVSRSGIADSFGCTSQIMSIASSATILALLLFGTPLLRYLPVPVLTGIVITALMGILETKLARRLWKTSRSEFLIFAMSFLGVLIFGTVYGVMIGCVLAFADVAISAVTPYTAFVGRIPGQGNFYPLDRNSLARPIKNTVIYRFSGTLFFANIDKFQSDIEGAVKEDTKQVIVDARGIDNMDITAVDRLMLLNKKLRKKGIHFYLTEHEGTLNDRIRTLGGVEFIESGAARRTITLALRDAGVEKPYELEEDGFKERSMIYIEADDKLAEFEWAFGDSAEAHIEKLAIDAAAKLVNEIENEAEHIDMLESHGVSTKWGMIGLFDENEFWDHLEMHLEKIAHTGTLTKEQLAGIEKRIEERRIEGEKRLKELNPHAMEILNQHRKIIREHLKERNPEDYARIHELRKKIRQMADKNDSAQ